MQPSMIRSRELLVSCASPPESRATLESMLRPAMLGACVVLALGAVAVGSAGAAVPPIGDGAWSWFGDPRAVTHNGRTYVGWVDLEGDIKVSSFNHGTRERVTAVLAARLNRDDHANPSIHIRPDGRLVIFYSRHVGPAMHYRVSTRPDDITSWEAPQTLPVNVAGIRGYTYPNPVRLAAEGRTYLFWRGGNYNPTFSVQADGSGAWSPARNLILMPGERPYAKYAQSGGDTIHVAYTNAHPNEYPSVNVHYARIRGGRIERAGGQQIGSLDGPPIAPQAGDPIFDGAEPSWVHDVAAEPGTGNPVIVFASFPAVGDHRYHYARWTGSAWAVRQMTVAGGSFREDGGSPYYSGGLTLDHEDPSRVYLSRQVGPGAWGIEVWTTPNGGATWTSQVVSAGAPTRNVRPVSPRGMTAFTDDLNVVWLRGSYPNYEEYDTEIAALTGDDANLPPVADAEPAVRSGPAPLEVRFDGRFSYDPGGELVSWAWDFGDGGTATGPEVTHTYTASGRYFPTLRVTDAGGRTSVLVEEIAVGIRAAPLVWSGGASGTTAHGAVDPENQGTQWFFEYGPTAGYGAVTPARSLPGDDSLHQVAAELPGLVPGRLYHYRLVASNSTGSSEGEDRVMVAGAVPGSDAYGEAVLATSGLASYRRLGELSGAMAADQLGGPPGSFAGRFLLGRPGILGPLGDTAAGFDGASGELATPGPALAANATIEGWFRWWTGTTVLRDHSSAGGSGWLPAFNSGGSLRYRLGGSDFNTGIPIEDVRDGTWHHIVATKSGASTRLYLDGAEVHAGAGAGSEPATAPWHVMRNGTRAVFSEGGADELALYTRALTAGEVRSHYDLARALAAQPLPPETPALAAEPPAAGAGLGGGVLRPGAPRARTPVGSASVRRGRLVVVGAPRQANRIVARRKGAAWRVSDAAAPLRAGAGCRRLTARTVTCRAARVKRIALYGGDGNDRLTVIGRIRSLLVGGRGKDRLSGGPKALFRGGPGTDRIVRRR
jgi:PKD repeat protein